MGLQYEGTRYHGFALQPGLPTIQLVVEQALADLLGHAVKVIPGGRTDAGVHATGQAVSLQTEASFPADAVGRALGPRLPDDVLATGSEEVGQGFDARRCARRRHYRYSILNRAAPDLRWRRYSLHVRERLDEAAMRRAACALLGRHDFSSFIGRAAQEPRPKSPVRTIEQAEWERDGDLLHFDCSAYAFARHMVRNLVGTMLWVGLGRLTLDDFQRVLAARERRAAGPTAPAHGLTLTGVDYDDPMLSLPMGESQTPDEDL
jgi:tRNA pseudouridine38-40 synthase